MFLGLQIPTIKLTGVVLFILILVAFDGYL